MEFYNPINDMSDLIGKWEGSIENEEKKIHSSLIFHYYGSDIIQYKQMINHDKSKKVLETGYFFFDKLKEELKHIVFNDEGYIEVNSLNLSKRAKNLRISSIFDSGYNLPPNIKIKREIKLLLDEKILKITLRMGNDSNLISEAIYEKIIE
jgi:hypothetical protein